MAEWSKCDWLPRHLALDELSLNELSWVMTLRLDAPVASPAAPAPQPALLASLHSLASLDSPDSPSRKALTRKLSNRLFANTSRARKKVYVQELEARVALLEQQNAFLREQLREAQRENMLLQAEVLHEHKLCFD